jgi:putative NADH-flavin reductase
MNIAIFGASGATGHELVKQALGQGHRVTAFVRNPAKLRIRDDHLKVLKGDVSDYSAVAEAVQQQDVAMSALGAKTPFKRNSDLIAGVRHIVKAMEHAHISRFIYLSFAGVEEGRRHFGFFFKYVIAPVLTNVIKDHEEKENIIKQSNLNWTIVRPPKLTNGSHTGVFRSGENIKQRSMLLAISRADVADFMVQQLTDRSFIKKAPLLMH